MKKESVLILGAGLMQKPAILSAKKKSFKTFVVDANPNAESVIYADEFCQIDLKDREEIYNYAAKLVETENLQGIFTSGTDFSASVSYSAEKLGLPCHSFESALNASVKTRMRECFQKSGVPSPHFYYLSKTSSEKKYAVTEENAVFLTEKLGFPCVVKPADNMGARGCRMVRSKDEAYSAVLDAAENSRTGTVILEEFMSGEEYSIDALVYNGTMTITGFADRHIFYPPYFIEMGHTMPSIVDEKKRLELIATFALGVKSLGLSCGAAKADIKYTEDGPKIGEIAARLSGGYMSGWTFPYSSSLNLTQEAILIACGKTPENLLKKRVAIPYKPHSSCKENAPFELFEVKSNKTSAERAWISIPGTIQSVSGIKEASLMSNIKNVFPRPVSVGSEVDFPRNNVQKCGNVISASKNYKKACNASENAIKNIFIRLEPNNKRTNDFLFSSSCRKDEKDFPPSAFPEYKQVKDLEISGIIPKNTSVLKNIPQNLEEFINSTSQDWNYLTPLETARHFDKICPQHPPLDASKFWKALFKGGIQAAVYVSDSFSENKSI